jgi:hypothetical protein
MTHEYGKMEVKAIGSATRHIAVTGTCQWVIFQVSGVTGARRWKRKHNEERWKSHHIPRRKSWRVGKLSWEEARDLGCCVNTIVPYKYPRPYG